MSQLSKQAASVVAAIVPGLPHLLLDRTINKAYADLAMAMEGLGDRFAAQGVKRLVYYSTQWISVLGHSFQAKDDLSGYHVDENWHDLVDLPFSFRVDKTLAERFVAAASQQAYQARLVDYEGFPVDTATIVADRLINKGRFATAMVSCCVYSDYADTIRLGQTLACAAKDDGVETAYVGVSLLSSRYFTHEIDLREDRVSSREDDEWNKRLLGLCEKGAYSEIEAVLAEYTATCKADMGLKALAFMRGVGAAIDGRSAAVRAYGGVYGTGAAVVEF